MSKKLKIIFTEGAKVVESFFETLGDQVVDTLTDNGSDYTVTGTKGGQAFSETFEKSEGYVITDETPE